MKRWFYIGILLLALTVACDHPTKVVESIETPSSPVLAEIDSLMWQHPDSALTCLEKFDSIGYGTVGAPNKHYLDLLHSEAIFKVRDELV